MLRGAFGSILRGAAIETYNRMFEPRGTGASGLADSPRPFVFRAAHLDGCTLTVGQAFHIDFHLFDMRAPAVEAITRAFAELARQRRAELTGITGSEAPLVLPLEPVSEPVERVTVRFVTPTELKTDGGLAGRPEFGVLARRIRDRISTLRELYDDGPLPIDFRGFGERAAQIRLVRCDVRQVEATRRSRRTGQVHSLGGFVGEAEYQGELAEFLPFLHAAHWSGVGRQTVWGKGVVLAHA